MKTKKRTPASEYVAVHWGESQTTVDPCDVADSSGARWAASPVTESWGLGLAADLVHAVLGS